MKINIVKARINRNMLDKLSGIYYKDENSDVIQYLNSVSKPAVAGIQREDGVYTALSYENVYYSTPSGVEGKIHIGNFMAILKETTMSHGKAKKYEFIQINERDSIWVMNSEVMSALWNTMLLLHKN